MSTIFSAPTDPRAVVVLLLTAVHAGGCVRNPPDRGDRYAGPHLPCSVAYVDSVQTPGHAAFRHPAAAFWEPGPHPTWNTHPDYHCNDNPVIDVAAKRRALTPVGYGPVKLVRDVEIYLTFPTEADPSVTGTVRVADGPFPVIVFAHANHDRRCQIFEDYWSLHDHWASWGYVVASVDGTRFNCDQITHQNINLRSQTQVSALDTLAELNETPGGAFEGRFDLERVIFAGHSRGGGASFMSARAVQETVGVISLQGIHIRSWRSRSVAPVPTLAFTAGRDVDLEFPTVEPTEDQLAGPYTWVNVVGGIHAFTGDALPLEWDDRPGIRRDQQHDVTELYTTAFLARVAGTAATARVSDGAATPSEILYSHRGSAVSRDEISYEGVYQRWRAPGAEIWVDHFDGPTGEGPLDRNELGGTNRATGFVRAAEVPTYQAHLDEPTDRYRESWSQFLWATHPAVFEVPLDAEGPLDVSSTPTVQLRARGTRDHVVADVEVEFVSPGGSARRSFERHRGPLPLSNRFQQVVIPVPPEIDPTALTALRFHVAAGMLFIDDLRFAAR